MKVLIISILITIFYCSNAALKSGNEPKIILTINDLHYWQNINAVDFMDTLIAYGSNYIFRIEVSPPKSWYNEKFIKELEVIRNDNSYSASVITPAGEEFGELFCGSTTITQEVNHLIEGIKKKRYPYYRSSACFYHRDESNKKLH
jgi:hypothetical protein